MINKIATLAIFLLLISSSSQSVSTKVNQDQKERSTPYVPPFSPENITLQDDAFHQPTKLIHIETWYFDAKLDNNISTVFVICLFQIHHVGIVVHGFYLYNDSTVVYAKRGIARLQQCVISRELPYVRIGNTMTIQGWMENETNQWKYLIDFSSTEVSVTLHFTRTEDGWKGSHPLGWWLAIPKFSVNGTIVDENSITQVSGKGYHDHNIYPLAVSLLAEGYTFGSISGETLSITWAKIEMLHDQQMMFAILSDTESGYSIITPNAISFEVVETMYDHGRYIPKTCRLTISSDDTTVNLTFQTISTHFIKSIGIKYWRYHLHVSGCINSKSTYENIENTEILELLKFL